MPEWSHAPHHRGYAHRSYPLRGSTDGRGRGTGARCYERRVLDLVIVGGGPAGLSTALHVLAAAPATRLAVLEKERAGRARTAA